MDPWYSYGQADPLDAAFILLHYAHMAGHGDVGDLWEMLTAANAEIWGLDEDEYGLHEGAEGSLVVYGSPDGYNALRTRAPRTLVVREGERVASADPRTATVERADGATEVDFHR
jgi:cytosine deaminase